MGEDWPFVGEASRRLHLGQDKVRELVESGYLRSLRPPSTGKGHSRRRIDPASIDELLRVMGMPDGPEKDAAMEEMRRRNRG